MAEVKAAEKGRQSEHLEKKCQAGETAPAVAKLLIKTAVRQF
ncbi:MAG: hypothetical protein ACLR2G_07845 [Phascolarctobacterium faecium]